MRNLKNKRVTKLTAKDLKDILKGVDDDTEIVLGFYMKEEGVHYGYLADTSLLKYDSVLKEQSSENILELSCFSHQYCSYMEKRHDG